MPGGRSGDRGGQTTTALWHGGGTGGGTGDGEWRGLALRVYEINTQKNGHFTQTLYTLLKQ
jgi:hypothetical protein